MEWLKKREYPVSLKSRQVKIKLAFNVSKIYNLHWIGEIIRRCLLRAHCCWPVQGCAKAMDALEKNELMNQKGCRTSLGVIQEVPFLAARCFVLCCSVVQSPRYSKRHDVYRSFCFNSCEKRSSNYSSFCCFVFLDRESSMPQQQYWRTGKMKVSSPGKNSLSKVASSRRTLPR